MQVKTPTEPQMANLMAWRAVALDRMPYFSAMLFSLRVLDGPGLQTFACDAQHRLYIDFDYIEQAGWSPTLCAEALLHECGHLFGQHAERATDSLVRDEERRDWNCAGDAEINDDLRDAGCTELTKMCVLPASLGQEDYQTAETYMEALRAKRKAQQQKRQAQGQPQQQPGGTGSGNSQGQGEQSQSQQGSGSGQGGDGDGGGDQPFAGCGSAAGGQAAPGELGEGDLDGAAEGASGIERERTRIATASNIREYAAKGRGNVPGGLVEIATQVLAPPKVPWRKTLAASVRRGVAKMRGNVDSTYTKRNRRRPTVAFGNDRIVRPGRFAPKPSIAFVRDTSGSMSSDDIAMLTNEIEGIAKGVGIRGRELRVYDVDAAVHGSVAYKGAKSVEEVHGRGGTDMCVGIEAASQQKPLPSAIVVGTDGWTPWPTERLAVPLIICIVPQNDNADVTAVVEACPEWATVVVCRD